MENLKEEIVAKPFLRWAGGKNWLIKYLDKITKNLKYNNYYEPFLGGGSIFFSMNPREKIYISDLNEELMNAYKIVQKEPNRLVEELRSYDNNEEFYYEMRSKKIEDPFFKAAEFIYLNKTSFNGIYRVNNNGDYNVPFGFKTQYNIDEENFYAVSKRLKKANIHFGDFSDNVRKISEGDLVVLDPPYTVSHNENGFIKYNQKLFSIEDQYRLSRFIDQIKASGAYYILTNAAHETIIEIFDKEGDYRYNFSRASSIGGKNASRGQVKEFVFTNIREG